MIVLEYETAELVTTIVSAASLAPVYQVLGWFSQARKECRGPHEQPLHEQERLHISEKQVFSGPAHSKSSFA